MARGEGLSEEQVCKIGDEYGESDLPSRYIAALKLTDAIIGDPRSLPAEAKEELRAHFTELELVELALGVSLFLSMSKVLITLGLEPDAMPTTIVATPGSAGGSDQAAGNNIISGTGLQPARGDVRHDGRSVPQS